MPQTMMDERQDERDATFKFLHLHLLIDNAFASKTCKKFITVRLGGAFQR